ncbi:MAG: acyl-CoA thioesterase [Clostridiaceae bacterium]|nr:acyl-CoA thioesterase [Clostridiaceae bacterium]
MVFETFITVRYCETDKMGVVHHSRYFPYFEEARCAFLENVGANYSDIENAGIMLPVIESYCKYHKGAKFGDRLVIKTKIAGLSPIKIKFGYNILKDGDLICEGFTTHCFVDSLFKPVNLKKKNEKLYSLLESLSE